jgi:dTDP-4-dehydrorhamnose reductase
VRVLILGGSGMLGHKLWQTFAPRFETYVTLRHPFSDVAGYGLFDERRTVTGVTAENFDSVASALSVVGPDAVVNCIGIVKQDAAAKDPIASISVNALFPHELSQCCRRQNARLIHLSTDCVFSGDRGHYPESELPDPVDLYGRTKLLGEVTSDNSLTIRTSMIGRELRGAHGLVEWFLSQQAGRVRGFQQAIFSGLTTNTLAKTIAELLENHQALHGMWHVASEPISKFDLLTLIKQTYGLDIEIEPDDSFRCNRSLDGRRFAEATGIKFSSWAEMIAEMHSDPTPYEAIRRHTFA